MLTLQTIVCYVFAILGGYILFTIIDDKES